MSLELQWYPSLAAADFPAADYEQLRQQLADSTPFNHLGWLLAAEAALTAGQQLQVLVGRDQGRLCLCLPLVRGTERFGPLTVQVVRHLGYPLSDRIALLCDLPAKAAAQVLRAIRKQLPMPCCNWTKCPTARRPTACSAAGQGAALPMSSA